MNEGLYRWSVDQAKKLHNIDSRRCMIRYIKIAFNRYDDNDVNELYDFLKTKIALYVNDNDMGYDTPVAVKFLSESNKIIACEIAMSYIHSYKENGEEKFSPSLGNSLADTIFGYSEEDRVRMNVILNVLYEDGAISSSAYHPNDVRYGGESTISYKTDCSSLNDIFDVMQLPSPYRNSEHKRKILRPMRTKKKIVQHIKKHTIRKSIGF